MLWTIFGIPLAENRMALHCFHAGARVRNSSLTPLFGGLWRGASYAPWGRLFRCLRDWGCIWLCFCQGGRSPQCRRRSLANGTVAAMSILFSLPMRFDGPSAGRGPESRRRAGLVDDKQKPGVPAGRMDYERRAMGEG